ncbi:hypothetical protein HanXRQr2_Chr09g0390481 [Helianthus annuus]|uniref:Uncharacterized protein n=1 Tax=Helianthus annuus TaxID=4232 RepID=A0A9K3I6A0_HELAN|nr:hypothetical protein HanXRQr2_Chr09g0390481 [Helianthus annuus]KAJ0526193.1 hypothetical protein HanHA300_Chr09g0320501 [Helianthus annuus]KAJ0534550.1 hypothetical protein HanIR_Chr09g0421041 [Helianthus annuus]KAJ0542587.1 hypothetical protein HanHA89_Chr09g0341431 [Helianthus annuus]KAJ0707642.1 hypothetical protein HanLR1_Chr09g0320761 [Helianthus annuus]
MAKIGTRSSPGVSPDKDDEIKSQNLLVSPSLEIYKFTDPEVQSLASFSPWTPKKEPSKSLSFQEPRAMTTRAKAGSKRKKPAEPKGDSFEVEKQLHDSLTEGFARVKAHYEKKKIAELEENLVGMRSIVVAKDKALSKLEKEKKGLEEQLLFS